MSSQQISFRAFLLFLYVLVAFLLLLTGAMQPEILDCGPDFGRLEVSRALTTQISSRMDLSRPSTEKTSTERQSTERSSSRKHCPPTPFVGKFPQTSPPMGCQKVATPSGISGWESGSTIVNADCFSTESEEYHSKTVQLKATPEIMGRKSDLHIADSAVSEIALPESAVDSTDPDSPKKLLNTPYQTELQTTNSPTNTGLATSLRPLIDYPETDSIHKNGNGESEQQHLEVKDVDLDGITGKEKTNHVKPELRIKISRPITSKARSFDDQRDKIRKNYVIMFLLGAILTLLIQIIMIYV